MGKIYSPPEEIKAPKFNLQTWREDEQKFTDELKAYCVKHGSSDYKGKIAQFPVADGYAMYMVFSMKPLVLIHIPLGDAWHYQPINRLPAADIKQNIDGNEMLAKLFSKKS